jgi:hypothetical protein
MAITADFTITYDTDVRVPFVIWDGDGLTDDELQAQIDAGTARRKDLTGATIAFYLRKKVNTPDPPLIYKSTETSPSGVSVDGTFGGSPDQIVYVTFEDTDTYDPTSSPVVNVKPGRYPYALKELGDGIETILARGTVTVELTAGWE